MNEYAIGFVDCKKATVFILNAMRSTYESKLNEAVVLHDVIENRIKKETVEEILREIEKI